MPGAAVHAGADACGQPHHCRPAFGSLHTKAQQQHAFKCQLLACSTPTSGAFALTAGCFTGSQAIPLATKPISCNKADPTLTSSFPQRVLLHHLSTVSCSSSRPLHLSSCIRPSRGHLRGRHTAHPAQTCTALGGAVRAVLLTQLAGAAVLSDHRSRRTSMHMILLLLLLSCLVVQLTHSECRDWAGHCCLVLLWWRVVAIRCGTTTSSSATACWAHQQRRTVHPACCCCCWGQLLWVEVDRRGAVMHPHASSCCSRGRRLC